MSVRICPEAEGRIAKVMFKDFPNTDATLSLRKELRRYIPELRKMSDADKQGKIYIF